MLTYYNTSGFPIKSTFLQATSLLVINPVGVITLLLSRGFCHIASQIYCRVLLQLFVIINDSNPFLSRTSIHVAGPIFLWFLTPFPLASFLGHAIVVCFQDNPCSEPDVPMTLLDIWISRGWSIGGHHWPTRTILMGIPLDLWKRRTREH